MHANIQNTAYPPPLNAQETRRQLTGAQMEDSIERLYRMQMEKAQTTHDRLRRKYYGTAGGGYGCVLLGGRDWGCATERVRACARAVMCVCVRLDLRTCASACPCARVRACVR